MSYPHTAQQDQVTAPIRRVLPFVADVVAAVPVLVWPAAAAAVLIIAAVILATSVQEHEGWGGAK